MAALAAPYQNVSVSVPSGELFMRTIFCFAFVATVLLPTIGYSQAKPKNIVFIAGKPSHNYGSHEHFAGSKVLAEVVQRTDPNVRCEVIRNGWPEDDSALDRADAIVIYSDGGGGHPSLAHLPRLKQQIDRGVGFICLHYGVEVPKDRGGPEFLQWLGGYFETHWSVNPHWDAKFEKLPVHPITSGVKPFETRDEWYFHMRFPEGMKNVTPILSAVPPASTMNRPDGPHSGNPTVRAEVARGELQHVAWATERPNGGRSFGFTGGHFHWNWGRTEQTKLVANAILWAAHANIPTDGALVAPLTVEQLKENQDESVPAKFDAKQIAEEFKLISTKSQPKADAKGKVLFTSQTINNKTSRHQIDVEADIRGVKKLYLIVTAGRDGMGFDWANWVEPKLVGSKGEKSLLDLNWFEASSEWGKVHKNANAGGGPMLVRNKPVNGIGTHATSVIGFDLPEGHDKLSVSCALDDGGVSQNDGSVTSVRFHIAAEGVPQGLNDWGGEVASPGHAPENAVAGLLVAPGLQACLAASEPMLKSLTNIDIDHKGRIWACEVVNYRRHKDDRKEGDRILILEDTNHDGLVDTSKVFYQGRDIDSALGLCVMGNRVLVSAAPYVWEFVDENGDDVPDKKTAILTKTGDPQHDHSVHSFVFGPDGKLYFNYGNTGHRLCDANGNPIQDRWGRDINDSGKPYRQGMVFRCNEDLSNMEVLGHNFRNNYEVALDSFGSLWQSDNDDDGNRATRINYVMEFGNYGYVDELTGAGWQAERANWEPEIPRRHWHLNDPGVVPNLLITGAGSPTGITVYEGSLLPEKFRNQVIHCDAGPNVVRAYIAKPEGAGYSAEIENIAVGEFDRWFRPADVCVAPDGSLFVSDWYDPGVGGHAMEDMERGRLFRIAPPGTTYDVPTFDFTTAAGACLALKNPNHSARFMAFQALVKMGKAAVADLQKLASEPNPRIRARALWVLAKIMTPSEVVQQAMADGDRDVRITGIRIARQAKMAPASFASKLLQDKEPAVLRELCVALREDKSEEMPALWASLATKHDGKDRWFLESLGIAAMDRWDECMAAWEKVSRSMSLEAREQIIWRARGSRASQVQADALRNPKIQQEFVPAFFRALDFQAKEFRDPALKTLLSLANSDQLQTKDKIVVEALMRLDNVDISTDPKLSAAVKRYLATIPDDPIQLKVISKLQVNGFSEHLTEKALAWGVSTNALQAIDLAASDVGTRAKWKQQLSVKEPDEATLALSRIIALSNRKDLLELQESLLASEEVSKSIRVESAVAMSRNKGFHESLISLAKQSKLPTDAMLLIGSSLRSSANPAIKEAAEELFPTVKSISSSLPAVEVLVKRKGNVAEGRKLYSSVSTCSQCHVVGTEGKNVGPSLTEIGSKLSKDALYISILAPSAGISHNFESYAVRTEDDEVITGLKVSETAEAITLKDAKGIDRSVPKANIAELKKLDKSLMPENLAELVSEQGLVDLVEYLSTLRKK